MVNMIINCMDCKAEISATADTCPKCGSKYPKGLAFLEVTRGVGWNENFLPYAVSVDGVTVGTVDRGLTALFTILPGKHVVSFSMTPKPGLQVPIVCENQQKVSITLKAAFFNRIELARLA